MNIKQAKEIPIEKIAEHLGGRQAQTKGHEVWFFSPFRPNESTASFKVNLKLNTWYDFGSGQGGSILDLWLDFHQLNRKDGNAIKTALEGLKPFAAHAPIFSPKRAPVSNVAPMRPVSEDRFTLIKEPGRIWIDSLKQEMGRRRISPAVGNQYLKQAYFKDTTTGKSFNGFAFANDREGYEISVPNPTKGISFKTVIGPKGPTTIRNQTSDTALIFEGFWDYLSFLEMNKKTKLDQQAIILNSLSFIKEAAEGLIKQKDIIKKVFLFQDNDDAGDKALLLMADLLHPEDFIIGTMNHLYTGKKDLNDFWRDAQGQMINHVSEPKIYAAGVWAEQERTKILNSKQPN